MGPSVASIHEATSLPTLHVYMSQSRALLCNLYGDISCPTCVWQTTDCLLLVGLDGFYKPLHLHFTFLREFTLPVLTIHRQPPGCPSVLGVQKIPVSLILSWSGQRLHVHNAILSAFTTDAVYSIWHRRHCHRRERPFWCFRFCLFCVYLHACRIGEASNPGPDTPIRFAVLNPTSLSNKRALLREIGADILCLSETSCTAAAQREEQRLLKDDLGFSVQCRHTVRPAKGIMPAVVNP